MIIKRAYFIMLIDCYFLDLNKSWVFSKYFRKCLKCKNYAYPSSWIRVVPCERKDIRDEVGIVEYNEIVVFDGKVYSIIDLSEQNEMNSIKKANIRF
jgi:hypothetical protein